MRQSTFTESGISSNKFSTAQIFYVYRIENDVVYVDDIFHELQDYETK